MKITKWVDSSLRTKMLVMFVILTITPLIFVGLISYSKSYNIVSEQSQKLAQLKADELTRDIDVLFQDINRFNEISEQQSTVQFLINQEDTYEEAKEILNMFNFYRESYPSSSSIFDIRITSNDGKAISEKRGVYQIEHTPSDDSSYEILRQNPNTSLIAQTEQNGFPAISITRTIVWDVTDTVIGYTTILIDAATIEDILHKAKIGNSGSFYIQEKNGTILFEETPKHSNPNRAITTILQDTQSGHFVNDSSTFFVFQTSKMTGWKVIGYAPVKEIMKDANEIRSLIILSVMSSIVFTIGLYFFISNRLILPIRNLKNRMKQASQGNFDVKVVNDGGDEIADLGNSFNIMISKIKSLLQKSIEEQKQLKIAEFRAMQAQINPHFLYNTLDTIIWMVESKKSSQVIGITKALSQFCRISLSKGKDWITIEDEIEHIRNYLIIQKVRYEDILEVSFHLNDEIYRYRMMKLLLQPLVENAIYHGIKNKRGKGFIRIKGDFDQDGNICIDIIDNGIGMDEQRLDEIRKQLTLGIPFDNRKGGFGMINVQQRIRLYYGEPYGLTINSWYGSGTRICLRIPAEE
ncbi:cache domain-containing sensor histidine kinase [Aquibacillus kalidii]|uniref:cache domain-containing sensor histidine kinase n=1 Tax=Aquibacillus kalidii TaxID=2762597 RepID=UPI0016466528|nr:sensor histidine kinase [Aquibacillus kalidii]